MEYERQSDAMNCCGKEKKLPWLKEQKGEERDGEERDEFK
jgi:hypothetical protein